MERKKKRVRKIECERWIRRDSREADRKICGREMEREIE